MDEPAEMIGERYEVIELHHVGGELPFLDQKETGNHKHAGRRKQQGSCNAGSDLQILNQAEHAERNPELYGCRPLPI
jgi:hypothetical protein